MSMTLKVVTENNQEMKRQEGNRWKERLTRTWQRDDNVFENCATLIPCTLSQCRCDNIGRVRIKEWIVHCFVRTRKMCVCAREGRCGGYTSRHVHGSCYCLHAKLPDSATSVEEKWYKTRHAISTHKLILTTLNLSSTHAVSTFY